MGAALGPGRPHHWARGQRTRAAGLPRGRRPSTDLRFRQETAGGPGGRGVLRPFVTPSVFGDCYERCSVRFPLTFLPPRAAPARPDLWGASLLLEPTTMRPLSAGGCPRCNPRPSGSRAPGPSRIGASPAPPAAAAPPGGLAAPRLSLRSLTPPHWKSTEAAQGVGRGGGEKGNTQFVVFSLDLFSCQKNYPLCLCAKEATRAPSAGRRDGANAPFLRAASVPFLASPDIFLT